ncbi:MAG: ATP-binding cassette domain-containing protein [Smithella sp.]
MIEIMGLIKNYGQIRAVDNLTLTIVQGEVFGLIGPNGAGKTTTIKILTTLTKPDAGHCLINGFDVVRESFEIKKRISVVPQENNLDRELTAGENLEIYGLLHSVSDRKTKIRECLTMVNLWDRRDSIVSGFSGGMQRRLLLARALLSQPTVLFLDEPSIGLDPQIRRQMWDMIRKTGIEGRTVVLTTHYIEEAEALCHRVGIMSHGRLIALDTPGNLKCSIGEYVVEFIDEEGKLQQQICPSRDEANKAASGYSGSGNIIIRKTNLEDVFIQLTGERIE